MEDEITMSDLRLVRLERERLVTVERYADGWLTREELRAELKRIRGAKAKAKEIESVKNAKPGPWDGVAAGVTQFGLGRNRRHPSAARIASAQRHLWVRRFNSATAALTHCWACSREHATGDLEKAHIHPVRFGGNDAPGNFFLLCSWCHIEQDDEASRTAQLRWLREHATFAEHWRGRLADARKAAAT